MRSIIVILLISLFAHDSIISIASELDDKTKTGYIVIEKSKRTLTLFSDGKEIKKYKVSLGGNAKGHKTQEGDERTPEGIYKIDYRNMNSKYHRSLHISYPNEKDKKCTKRLGVSPGGNIMIHGAKNGFGWIGSFHTFLDWTDGCIAVTNNEIEEIWKLVPNGATVEIKP